MKPEHPRLKLMTNNKKPRPIILNRKKKLDSWTAQHNFGHIFVYTLHLESF
uniref:Uncharacterized protein n=1 Tax=Anguilla anguilla TaxID=7936 RepID=A0A0E9PLQ2_ANGAN